MNWFRRTFEIAHTSHKAILPMEGIRGLAVFLVFLVHYVALIGPWLTADTLTQRAAKQVSTLGNVGVDLFFVLSGFLIYGMLIKGHRPFFPYLKRRAERIYPTFLAVLGLYIVILSLMPEQEKLPPGVWPATILIIKNALLLPGVFDVPAIITVAWSLSYEFFYYILIPILIGLTAMRRWPTTARLAFFIALTAFLYWYCTVPFDDPRGLKRLLMFVPGIIMYEFIANHLWKRIPPIGLPALLIGLAMIPIMKMVGIGGWIHYVSLSVFFFLFCLEAFTRDGLTARVFSWAPLRWLGNMSYSYYLIHGLSLKFFFLVLAWVYPPEAKSGPLFWALVVPAFAVTLVPSALLFIWVEKPFSLAPRRSAPKVKCSEA